jgi:transposase
VEIHRPKKSCRDCERMVQTPAPPRPIPRGMAGPSLLAHILVAKFDDHLPLYRQGEIFARLGADIPRSTLIDWCGQAAAALPPARQPDPRRGDGNSTASTPTTRRSACSTRKMRSPGWSAA